MEKKTKVVIKVGTDFVEDNLLLSDEQVRLLEYLYQEDYICGDVTYELLTKENIFKEI